MSTAVVAQPEVTFHFNVAQPVDYLCRLLRKAYQAQLRALLCAPPAWATQVDVALWKLGQDDFLPHVLLSAPQAAAVQPHSPIWIADQLVSWPAAQVVINALPLTTLPPVAPVCCKLIEVVSLDEAQRQAARQRWRAYQATGYALRRHDAAATGH